MSSGGDEANIKRIQISEEVAKAMGGGEGTEGGTRRRRGGGGGRNANKTLRVGLVEKEGGGATSPGTLVQLAATHVPGGSAAAAPVVGRNSSLTQAGASLAGGGAAAAATPAANANVKVVLAPKAKRQHAGAAATGRLVLAAGKPAALKALKGGSSGGAAAAAHKTRKVRKIKMSMRGLSKKIHRARHIRQKASETTVEQIKKELHKAGLIKADSKAPEAIIRQMYADYMTLKTRAL